MNRTLILLVSALTLVAGIVLNASGAPGRTRTIEKTVALRSGGRVEIRNVSGPVTVSGWDREEVRVRAVIALERDGADEEVVEFFEGVEVEVKHGWNSVEIRTRYPDREWFGDDSELDAEDFDLDFDFDLDLDEESEDGKMGGFMDGIMGMVGSIVGGVTGWATRLVKEQIPVTVGYEVSVPSECGLEVINITGDILVTGVEGEIETRLVAGNVSLVEVSGELDCRLISGKIEIEDAGGRIETSVITGGTSIALAKGGWCDGVDCSVISGNLLLRVPDGMAMDFDLHAVNGQITLDTDKMRGETAHGTRHQGSLAGGGPEVKLKAINGSIRIERAVR
ncbi:MAG: hypothetical protein FVQ81_08465 [Candidatus Glassbacteria bacterium]|nr:hypothetical protein [Candidatus Glassbacteria bacterium]